jgi:hypothetical protein
MSDRKLTQTQIDRYDAFEAMLDLMDATNETSYTKDEILATIEQIVEQIAEDREEDAKPAERYLDRYPTATQGMTNRELLNEIDRLEMKTFSGTQPLDRFDQMRHDFVKQELNQRRAYGHV